jgi:PKD repeat protein
MKIYKLKTLLLALMAMAAVSPGKAQSTCSAKFTYTQTSGNTIVFSSSSAGTTSNTTYYWWFDDNGVASIPNPTHLFSAPGYRQVSLSIQDTLFGCNSFYSDSVLVSGTVICNMTTTQTSSATTCSSCTDGIINAQPIGGTAPYTYTCASGTSSGSETWSLAPGTYPFCFTDVNGCQACGSGTILAGTGYCHSNFVVTADTASNTMDFVSTSTGTNMYTHYDWHFDDNTNQIGQQVSHVWSSPGMHSACLQIYGTNGACTSDTCITFQVSGSLHCNLHMNVANIPATCQTCPNGDAAAEISNGTAPYTYSWSFNNDTAWQISGLLPGTYILSAIDANGCTGTTHVVVGITHYSCPTSYTSSQTSPNQISFVNTTPTDSSMGAIRYNWDFGDGNSSTEVNPVHVYEGPGTYSVCLQFSTANVGCYGNYCSNITVTGGVNCTLGLTLTGNSPSCDTCTDGYLGSTLTGGAGPFTFVYTHNGNVLHTNYNLAPGTYTACVTDVNGCRACSSVIIPAAHCNASFTLNSDSLNPGNYIATDQSSGTGPLFENWSWGDGTYDTLPNPSHTYANAGTYQICLTIHDGHCSSTSCNTLIATRMMAAQSASNHTTVNVRREQAAGISENTLLNNWNVFPNPTDGLAKVQYNLKQSSTILITLYDLTGRQMMSIENQSNVESGDHQVLLDTSSLRAGTYLIRIQDQQHQETKRICVLK